MQSNEKFLECHIYAELFCRSFGDGEGGAGGGGSEFGGVLALDAGGSQQEGAGSGDVEFLGENGASLGESVYEHVGVGRAGFHVCKVATVGYLLNGLHGGDVW